MSVYSKREIVTLPQEWEPELDRLKKEEFSDDTQAEMFRSIIRRGLDSVKAAKEKKETSI